MKEKSITVAQWMEECGIPYVIDAEKYVVGQELTEGDVEQIRNCLWYSIAYNMGMDVCYLALQFMGEPFASEFHHFFLSLIWDPRVPQESNWSEALWDSMEPKDRVVCHKLMRQMQHPSDDGINADDAC